MTIGAHLREFHGLPVLDFPRPGDPTELPATGSVAWRLRVDEQWESGPSYRRHLLEPFAQKWERFVATVDPAQVKALVVGRWAEYFEVPAEEIVGLLTGAADRFTGLRAVFLGDLVGEESDLAYIQLCDPAPLLEAYPLLEELAARGADTFAPVRHEALRTLRFESGGLPSAVLDGVLGGELPALESLDLWLGVDEYGADITVAQLQPLLDGTLFPRLRHLGLEDSELQDEIAAAVAGAPVVPRLESLSLALGTLTDDGAAALLTGQPLTHLKRLDLHHHFLSDALTERLRAALEPAGTELDLADPQEPEEEEDGEIWRYVANAE